MKSEPPHKPRSLWFFSSQKILSFFFTNQQPSPHDRLSGTWAAAWLTGQVGRRLQAELSRQSLPWWANHWKSLKIIANLWKSLKIIENHWKSLKIIENHCHCEKTLSIWSSPLSMKNRDGDPSLHILSTPLINLIRLESKTEKSRELLWQFHFEESRFLSIIILSIIRNQHITFVHCTSHHYAHDQKSPEDNFHILEQSLSPII